MERVNPTQEVDIVLKKGISGPRRSGIEDSFVQVHGHIICIESADPGFDWLFSRGIVGLITKFGGSNSHMGIRCAEFSIPAPIGCGKYLFDRLVSAKLIEALHHRYYRVAGVMWYPERESQFAEQDLMFLLQQFEV